MSEQHSYPLPKRVILNCQSPALRAFSESAEASIAKARDRLLARQTAAQERLSEELKQDLTEECLLVLRKLGLTKAEATSLLQRSERRAVAEGGSLWEKGGGDVGEIVAYVLKQRIS